MATEKTNQPIKPLQDFILVKMDAIAEETLGGIVVQKGLTMDDQSGFMRDGTEESTEGVIVDVGPGRLDKKGNPIPLNVSIGDRVLVEKGAGNFVIKKERLRLIRESEIMMVYDPS